MRADEVATPRMRAWVSVPDDAGRARVASQVLIAAGIDVDGRQEGPGVLIGTVEVCSAEAVLRLSANGTRRLVVVLVGARPRDPWALLAAGASDVLTWADADDNT